MNEDILQALSTEKILHVLVYFTMLLKSFFPAGLVASAAAAATSSPLVSRAALGGKVASGEVPLCGNEEPSESHKAFSKAMLENEKTILRMKQAFTVDVYFHVVSSSTSAEDGNISVRIDHLRVL